MGYQRRVHGETPTSMTLVMRFLIAMILCSGLAAAASKDTDKFELIITAGDAHNIGVTFAGNETLARLGLVDEQPADFEQFIEMLAPGAELIQTAYLDHAFILRTRDMQYRVKVSVFKNVDAGDGEFSGHPFRIEFKNLRVEDPEQTVELKQMGPTKDNPTIVSVMLAEAGTSDDGSLEDL